MATSRSVRLLTDERYVCSLCMESFQGRNPKLLPCFHTFCLPCLTTLAENATTKSLGSDNNDKDTELKKSEKTDDALDSTKQASGKANADEVVRSEFAGKVTFDCPTCRKIVVVPEDGVGSLQSNFYLDFGDATSSFARSLPCDMCEDGDKQRASQTCDECGIRLCSSCRRLHDLVAGARAHQMRPLPLSEQPQAPRTSKKRWCPSHADQLLCFHCRQCHAIICMHCKLTSHEGHVTEDIMAATIRAKEEMVGLTASATEQVISWYFMMDNTPGRVFPAIKMAECANKLSTVDCRFFCTLCREPLQGRTPKLLPCFHTFCLSCLTTLVEEAAAKLPAAVPCDNNEVGIKRKQRTYEVITNESISDLSATDQEGKQGTDNSDQITKEVTFDCPSCRYRVTVPQEGVSGLQTNVYLDTDAAPISPRLPECEMCEADDKKKASYTCVECGIAICTRCRRFHDVVGGAQSHRIFHLGSGQTAITRTSRKRWCPYHPDQWLSFNCRQCHMIICMFCKLTSHDGHITEDIISATVRAKEDAMHLIASAKEQILILESVRGHLERDKKELARQKEEVIHGVSARFENVISLATRARDEFLERLELDEEAALKKLNTDQTVVRCTVEKLLDLVSRVNGPASECSEPDVIQLSADLQATILHEVDLHHYRERVNASRGPVYFAHRTDESALDIENVRAYVGVMGDIDGSSSGPPVTLREIRRSVAEVTKLVEELQSEKASKTDVEKWRAKGSKMEKEIADIKDNMETLVNAKLQEVARKIETKLIAFNVRMEQRVTAVGDKPIPFDVIECNDGDGYDQHTGIFTVPLSGTYVFLASIYSSSNVAFYICVDGARVVQSVGYSFCFSANLVKKLRAGQQVSLQFSGAYYVESTPQTYFTGAIIQASA